MASTGRDDGFEEFDSASSQASNVSASILAPRPASHLSSKTHKEKNESILQQSASTGSGDRGCIYVGRIPHGFYEHQIREYFSQFGTITRLRLSRSRKTGRSKHYAFVEFESEEVARIAAATMDNYLMFGHILKARLVPQENVHDGLWKGANKRFKTVPWSKMEARKLAAPVDATTWTRRIDKEQQRRMKKMQQMKEMGYEFDLPTIKGLDLVPNKALPEPSKVKRIADNGRITKTNAQKQKAGEGQEKSKATGDDLVGSKTKRRSDVKLESTPKAKRPKLKTRKS